VHPLDDLFVIEVGRRRMVTGSEGLDGVMVEVRRGARAAGPKGARTAPRVRS
jgi:hypothetical protein